MPDTGGMVDRNGLVRVAEPRAAEEAARGAREPNSAIRPSSAWHVQMPGSPGGAGALLDAGEEITATQECRPRQRNHVTLPARAGNMADSACRVCEAMYTPFFFSWLLQQVRDTQRQPVGEEFMRAARLCICCHR